MQFIEHLHCPSGHATIRGRDYQGRLNCLSVGVLDTWQLNGAYNKETF
jgi:hypothetical protein